MAPVDDAAPEGGAAVPGGNLARYLDKDVADLIVRYDKLWEVEDPEETPYTSKYKARELLEGAVKEIERLLAETAEGGDAELGREMLARLFLFLGKNHYYCEEVPLAERCFIRSLERYLRSPLRLEPKPFVHIQDLFNQLGMLWCNRQGHGEGMNFLRRAQIMFLNRPPAVREACEQRADDNYTLTMFYLAQAYGALQKPALSARFCAETMSRQLDHNTSGRRSQEVLERDPFDCKDWVRNCCSLSDFFVNECMFWTAEYLLHSAAIMCERCGEICGLEPDGLEELRAECMRDLGNLYSTRLKFAKTCTEHPSLGEQVWRGERKRPGATNEAAREGTRLSFSCAADRTEERAAGGSEEPIAWDAVFPEIVHLEDEEAHDNRFAEETEADAEAEVTADEAAAAEKVQSAGWLELRLGERVRLPVYFRRLHEATQRRIHRANATFFDLRDAASAGASGSGRGDSAAGNLDGEGSHGSSDGGATADAANARHQPSCIGTSFEAAREIFKLGNHYCTRALGHFLLDGWVTEHVRILQELSQMYRSIQFWEKDPRRAAAVSRRRVRMLAPLLDVLNPRVYIAFWKQLSFEVAEVFQEIYELKAHGKMPAAGGGATGAAAADDEDEDEDHGGPVSVRRAARCNDLAQKAVTYYGKFIDSYHPDGKVPDKVDDDNTRSYLTARLNRARLRTKMRGLSADEELEGHKLALREYEWIRDYGCRHPEVCTKPEIGMAQELALCEEMAGMLPSKLSRIAAQRRR